MYGFNPWGVHVLHFSTPSFGEVQSALQVVDLIPGGFILPFPPLKRGTPREIQKVLNRAVFVKKTVGCLGGLFSPDFL